MSRFRISVSLLFALLLAAAPRAAAGELEILYLTGGDRFSGYNRGFDSGSILWEMPYGERLRIPIGHVERVEYPAAQKPDPSTTAGLTTEPDDVFKPEIEQTGLGGETAALTPAPDAWKPPVWARSYWYRAARPFERGREFMAETAHNWIERLEFGGRFLDGNSEEDNMNVLGKFEHEWNRSTVKVDAGGQIGRANGQATTNRWFGNATLDIAANDPKWVMFMLNRNEYDEFEGLDYRGSLAGGIGYRFFNEPDRRLIFRLGPGLTHERYHQPEMFRTTPDVLAEVELRWPLFERTEIEHKSTINPSMEDVHVFRLISDYGLLVRFDPTERWSIKIGLRHEYNSRPNLDREASDYTTGILLVYRFANASSPSLTNTVFPPRAPIFQK